jgi:hypothetical protein
LTSSRYKADRQSQALLLQAASKIKDGRRGQVLSTVLINTASVLSGNQASGTD